MISSKSGLFFAVLFLYPTLFPRQNTASSPFLDTRYLCVVVLGLAVEDKRRRNLHCKNILKQYLTPCFKKIFGHSLELLTDCLFSTPCLHVFTFFSFLSHSPLPIHPLPLGLPIETPNSSLIEQFFPLVLPFRLSQLKPLFK